MALDFLAKRVHNTDGDDYKNLACTIHYIRGIRGIKLTLEADSMDTI